MNANSKISHMVAAFALALSSCSNHLQAESWDQQVLMAVLTKLCAQKTAGYVLIPDATSIVAPYFTPSTLNPSAKASLLDRNKASVDLAVVPHCENLKSIKHEQLERELGGTREMHELWSAFYERHAGASGVIMLSLPGYSEDGTIAVVQVAGTCGATCGGGTFWVLQRAGRKWEVAPDGTIEGWIN